MKTLLVVAPPYLPTYLPNHIRTYIDTHIQTCPGEVRELPWEGPYQVCIHQDTVKSTMISLVYTMA